ncbi:retropepsin-like aspartic protease [Pseudomonas sp. Z1-6]|uniref:retropepsin-like aspartic protease n=1 Tax=Pseudomonas sp. Z1-6 TaxID=2817407 RepID=UPI003DA94C39
MRPRAVIEDNVARIKFLNSDGTVSETPVGPDIIPVIEIHVAQDAGSGATGAKCLALLDTGADGNCIDRDFVETLRFFSDGTASPSGASGIVLDANVYLIDYDIPTNSTNRQYRGRFVAMPLSKNGRNYQVLLGMAFIKNGRLIMDSKDNEYLFEFN